ncbi:MAG: TonB-dependent receptor, partial [Gemmatimonadaceae bacterium]|nr:TonB-dependent receptor [Gemmatimonadaceae bacterium]
MRLLRTFIFAVAATFVATPLLAQVPQMPGQLTGSVVGEAGQPIGSASVAVRSARDSALVAGAIARTDGTFRIEGLAPGRYSVRLRAIGYAPVEKPLTITMAEPRVDFGNVTLAAVAMQLEGAVVTADADKAVLAPDRNSYTVRDMPTASGGNTVDVLRNVPGVEVDGDNRVSLRGNQNVVVQINGRATPMRGEQLGNFLAQLSSNIVERVEVVPNPSAKDDPEGMAGILNIVLKQNADLGTSAGIVLGAGTTGMMNGSGNVGHQQGPVTLFASYGYMRDERETAGFTNRENLFLTPTRYLNANNFGFMHPRSHNMTGTAEYKLNKTDVVSTNLLFNRRSFEREMENYYQELDAVGQVAARFDRMTEAASRDRLGDVSLAFKRTTQPQRKELSGEVRLNSSNTDFMSSYLDQARSPDGTAATTQPLRQQDRLDESRTDVTAQADIIRPFGARGKMEFGYKGVKRELDNGFSASRYSYLTNGYEPDAARSNAFNYQDQVHALYAVLSRSIGKFNLQGGIRGEQAISTFDLATTNESYDNDYRSLYPSGLVSYDATPTRQLKASYSKRVNRPHTSQMNPFTFREDALNTFRGNPFLKPEYTHAMELGFQESFSKGSIQLTPFFRHTVDAVRAVRTVDDNGVALVTFANVATARSYGADANGSFRLGDFTGFGGVNVFRSVTDASNLSTDVSNNSIGWSARVNASYKLMQALDAQSFLMYRAPMTTEQGRIAAMSIMTLALRQRVLNDKGSVTLRLQDPLNTMKFGFRQEDSRVIQVSERRFGARGVFLNFSYNYGQAPRLRQRTVE